jgi:hypothetical protein
MRITFHLLWAVGGECILGLPCHAQTITSSTAFPQFYVVTYLSTADYELIYPTTPNLGGTNPLMAAIGKQLATRWAVQISYAWRHAKTGEDPSHVGTTATGQPTYGWRSAETWTHALPFTVRYTLIPESRSRLQLDLIGGGTWVNSRFRVAAEDFINGQSLGIVSQEDHTKQWYLTAGLGARYSFSHRLEGVFDYTLIRNTQRIPDYVHLGTVGNRWGLTRSISLGLRYRFDVKKQAE